MKARVVAGVAVLSIAAPAGAVTYTGTVIGVPQSEITLTFTPQDGLQYLDQYAWGQLPWNCDNGMSEIGLSGGYDPPDGLVQRRRFRIHRSAPENNFVGLLSGEFNKSRSRVLGELRYRAEHSDPNLGVCDTGKLEFRVRKEI